MDAVSNVRIIPAKLKSVDSRNQHKCSDIIDAEKCVRSALAKNTSGNSVKNPQNAAIMSFVIDDETEEFLSGIEVIAAETKTGKIFTAETDRYGHFELILPEGNYFLTVDAENYKPYVWGGSGKGKYITVKNGQINYLADGQGLSEDEAGWIRLVQRGPSLTELAKMSTDEIIELMGGEYTVNIFPDTTFPYFFFNNYDVFPGVNFMCLYGQYKVGSLNSAPEWDESFVRAWLESGAVELHAIKIDATRNGDIYIDSTLKTSYDYKKCADVLGDFECIIAVEPFITHNMVPVYSLKTFHNENCEIDIYFDRDENFSYSDDRTEYSSDEMNERNPLMFCVTVVPDSPDIDYSNQVVGLSEDFKELAGLQKDTNLYAGPSVKWAKLKSLKKSDKIQVLHTAVLFGNDYWYYVSADNKTKGWIKSGNILWYGAKEKPVIYLYPEEETEIDVKLILADGQLTCTYPDYRDGWSVVAESDGTIHDKSDGREYSYLYWEGQGSTEWDFSEGFVVSGKDTAEFLQEKLSYLGLTPREYNEFIVYWLPKMQENEYNLISFQKENYTSSAVLEISPKPDCIQRVFMAYKACDEDTVVPEQKLERFQRNGFTVIEWGGTEINDHQIFK